MPFCLQEFHSPYPVGVGRGFCYSNKCLYKGIPYIRISSFDDTYTSIFIIVNDFKIFLSDDRNG